MQRLYLGMLKFVETTAMSADRRAARDISRTARLPTSEVKP